MANMLYNGVELPDINTVWTDKETYPYAVIVDASSVDYGYVLSLTSSAYTYYNSNIVVVGRYQVCALVDGVWTVMESDTSTESAPASLDFPAVWSSYDILNADNTIYLAASEPVDPNAVSHVTTSSGNGFALYNGVKLPNIDSVWADKETYPYVYISGGADLGYMLTCTKVQAIHYGDGDVEIRNIATIVYLCVFLPGETEWTIFGEDVFDGTGSYIVASGTAPMVWTNTDILNTDNTVYFAASDPIPLDGMTVIEWDGDTTGLPSFMGIFYRVADYFKPTSALAVYDDSVRLIVSDDFQLDGESGAWSIGRVMGEGHIGGLNPCTAIPMDIEDPDIGFVPSGIYLSAECSLIAYTSSGGGEPTYDRTAFLRGMAMGLTGKGNPVSLQTTVKTMLYNGVELPELPEWDKTKYPYAFITFDDSWIDVVPGVTRHELVTADAAPVWGETYNGEPAPVLANCTYQYARVYNQLAQDIVVGEGGSKYDFPTNKEGWSKFKSDTLAEDHRLALDQAIWCNNTLLDGDGSVLLVASEPVPTSSSKASGDGYASPSLASEPTVEDSFTNGYKVGAALRRKRVIVSTEVLDNTVPITWNTAAVANNIKVVVDDIPFVRISSLYAEHAADVYSNAGALYIKAVENNELQVEFAVFLSQVVSLADGVFLAVYEAEDTALAAVSVPEDGMVIEGVTVPRKGIYVMDMYALGMGEYELRLDAGDPPKVFFDSFPIDLELTLPQIGALAGENEIPLYQEDGTQNGSLLKVSNLTPTLEELNTVYNTSFTASTLDGVTEASDVKTCTWHNVGTFVKDKNNEFWVVYEPHTLHTTVFDNASVALTAEVTPGIYLSDKSMFALVLGLALLANASKNGSNTDDSLRMFLGTAEDAATALAEYGAIAET